MPAYPAVEGETHSGAEELRALLGVVFGRCGMGEDDAALLADTLVTADPAAAMDGLLMPIGAFKGTALAFVMGIFASMLSGAAYGTELGSIDAGAAPGQDGHFVMAVNVAAFEDVARFKSRIDAAIRQLHNAKKTPGVERIYAPGELEFETQAAYWRDGIPLNDVTLRDIARTAEGLGVDVPASLPR